jgi:putative ABC transport system permease protein
MHTIFQDLSYSFRTLWKNPGFSLLAILTLALGIAANTTIFSMVNGVLLGKLPYQDPDKLVTVWNELGDKAQSLPATSPQDFQDYLEEKKSFEGFAAVTGGSNVNVSGNLSENSTPEIVETGAITDNFFSLLGLKPALGRDFHNQEIIFQGPKVAILSYELWQERYGSNSNIIGTSIGLGKEKYTVVGVAPKNFQLLLPEEKFFINNPKIWVPLQIKAIDYPRNFTFLMVIGRIKPSATFQEAQEEMNLLAERLRGQHLIHKNSNLKIKIVPLHLDIVKNSHTAIWVLFGAVAFVLLIACGNVASLLLAKANSRKKEIAIRLALGASRGKIIQQLLIESMLIAVVSGIVGLWLSSWGIQLILLLSPPSVPRLDNIKIDQTVLFFTTISCIATTIIFGLFPALRMSSPDINSSLKMGSRTSSSSSHKKLRQTLIIVEIALSFVLLIGAGLFIRSFIYLQKVDPGFNPENILTFQISLPTNDSSTFSEVINLNSQIEGELSKIAGIKSVGTTLKVPLSGAGPQIPYAYDAETEQKWESVSADWRPVTPGYFQTMGVRLIAGRNFTRQDDLEHPAVVIVDSLLARRAWPGENPVGKKIKIDRFHSLKELKITQEWVEIIGVVEHTRNHDLTKEVREQFYVSAYQQAMVSPTYVIKINGDKTKLLAECKKQIRLLSPDAPISNIKMMSEYVYDANGKMRFILTLVSVFGVLALGLASVGLYGVISYSVSQQTHEIGVRMALGAAKRDIFTLVLFEGIKLIATGLVIGFLASLMLTRFISSLLFSVSPNDPIAFLSVAVLLSIVALLACFLPSRKATKVDPIVALRCE